jgi:hypothetical protein
MVKIDNLNQTQTNPNTGVDNQPNNQNQNQKPNSLITTIGSLLPLVPFA